MDNEELTRAMAPMLDFLKNTEEYKRYAYEKKKLEHFPELKRQIDEFRLRNFKMQSEASSEEIFDRVDDFRAQYEQFRDNPIVSDFLEAELSVCRMIQNIYITVTEAVDFDLDLSARGI